MNKSARSRGGSAQRAAFCLEPALALAARGFAVFPLRPNSKVPAVPRDWEGLAAADAARVRELMRPGRANVGVACGPSGLLVLDLDIAKRAPERGGEPRHGADALRALAGGRPLPPTMTVATPSGGLHLYYARPEGVELRNTVGRLGPLIDTRGMGGYVVGPGSRLGPLRYELVSAAPVAPLPDWLVEALLALAHGGSASRSDERGARLSWRVAADPVPSPPLVLGRNTAAYGAAALRNEVARVRMARIGTRNDTLNRAAYSLGRLIGAGLLDCGEAERALLEAAQQAGLSAREATLTLASGLRAGMARPRVVVNAADAVSRRREVGTATVSALPQQAPQSAARRGASAGERPHQAAPVTTRTLNLAPGGWSPRARGDQFDAARPRQIEAATELSGSLRGALRALDRAYDAAARCAAPIAGEDDWRRVRLSLETLRDQIDAAPRAQRVAALCDRVGECTRVLAARFPAARRRSPLGAALRELRRAAETAAACARERPASAGPVTA